METIVTDHHQPAEELPDCPILHPALSGYPFAELCGTAVAWKLACALRAASGWGPRSSPRKRSRGPCPDAALADLDLVALATVADVVPLVGENRSLVRRGLEVMRRGERPGLRALIAASKVELAQLDESDLGFKLGRGSTPPAASTAPTPGSSCSSPTDEARAAEIANELNRANSERRRTEREVDECRRGGAARASRRAARGPGLVLAGAGLAPGRDRDRRLAPGRASLPAGGGDLSRRRGGRAGLGPQHPRLRPARRRWRPARSIWSASAATGPPPGWSCGPRTSMPSAPPSPLTPTRCSAPRTCGGPSGSTRWSAAPASASIWPRSWGGWRLSGWATRACGCSSPPPGSATCGRWGRASTPASASTAVPTGRSGSPSASSSSASGDDEPVDAAVRLEVNHWNGSVEPRVVLRELYPPRAEPRRPAAPRGRRGSGGGASRPSWLPTRAWPAARGAEADGGATRRGGSCAAAPTLAGGRPRPSWSASGGSVARARPPSRRPRAPLDRAGLTPDRLRRAGARPGPGGDFAHVVLVDPPPSSPAERLVARSRRRRAAATCPGLGRGRAALLARRPRRRMRAARGDRRVFRGASRRRARRAARSCARRLPAAAPRRAAPRSPPAASASSPSRTGAGRPRRR